MNIKWKEIIFLANKNKSRKKKKSKPSTLFQCFFFDFLALFHLKEKAEIIYIIFWGGGKEEGAREEEERWKFPMWT